MSPSDDAEPAADGEPAPAPDAGALARAAHVAVKEVLDVHPGERALIVTNPVDDVEAIGRALETALDAAGAEVELLMQEVKGQFDLADDAVLEALHDAPDIGLSISADKLGKDPRGMKEPYDGRYDSIYQYLLATERLRGFWSPGVTVDTFCRCVPVDYAWLRDKAAALKSRLDAARRVRITTEAGTDLTFGVDGREAFVDDGDFRTPGKGGNLPCGEAYVSPALETAEGTLVVDGAIATADGGTIVPEDPIEVIFERGYVAMVSGDGPAGGHLQEDLTRGAELAREWADAGRLPEDQVGAYSKNASHLGEFGVGLNRNARIVGNLLEDEKVHRTCHLAIGSNYDHDAPALIHLDCVVHEPTVKLAVGGGHETVVEAGELRV